MSVSDFRARRNNRLSPVPCGKIRLQLLERTSVSEKRTALDKERRKGRRKRGKTSASASDEEKGERNALACGCRGRRRLDGIVGQDLRCL